MAVVWRRAGFVRGGTFEQDGDVLAAGGFVAVDLVEERTDKLESDPSLAALFCDRGGNGSAHRVDREASGGRPRSGLVV